MKNLLLTISSLFILSAMHAEAVMPEAKTAFTLSTVKVTEGQELTSKVLAELVAQQDLVIVAKGILDTINGIADNWYKVEYDSLKNTGYIFGHDLSVRKQGQQSQRLVFEMCEQGDMYHITFRSDATNPEYYDFGDARNNLCDLELCIEDENGVSGNPKYAGKTFVVVVNSLPAMCWDEGFETASPCEVKTIVSIMPAE